MPTNIVLCNSCSHSKVCQYKEQYKKIHEQIGLTSDENLIFTVLLNCNYYLKQMGQLR